MIFEGTAIRDENDATIDPNDQPMARARRGERFEMTITGRRRRWKLGRFVVISSPIGPQPGRPVSLEARPAD